MCANICESTNNESTDTDSTFGADFFFFNAGSKSFFFIFAQLKLQGRPKK